MFKIYFFRDFFNDFVCDLKNYVLDKMDSKITHFGA